MRGRGDALRLPLLAAVREQRALVGQRRRHGIGVRRRRRRVAALDVGDGLLRGVEAAGDSEHGSGGARREADDHDDGRDRGSGSNDRARALVGGESAVLRCARATVLRV